MSYNKNKFEHNLKKTKRQREFARFERQKLNNLFSIFADVNKNTLNNEQILYKALFRRFTAISIIQGNATIKRLINSCNTWLISYCSNNKQR